MIRRVRSLLVSSVLLAMVSLWAVGPAHAGFILRIEDSAGNGAVLSGTTSTNPSSITFIGALDNFKINVTTGVVFPGGGSGNYAELDLSSLNVSTSGGGWLKITLENTGFTGGPNGPMGLVGSIGGTATNASILAQSWANASNLAINLGPNQGVGSISPIGGVPAGSVSLFGGSGFGANFTGSSGGFSQTTGGNFTKSGPYALFQQVTLNFGSNGGLVSFDSDIMATPAPNGMILGFIGAGLLFGFYGVRRLRAIRCPA